MTMFLRDRATQAEYFDAPGRTREELREHYAWLNRVNRLMRFERPFRLWLPRLLGEGNCARLTLLDVGGGDGQLGRTLGAWAAARGWDWRTTTLDLCADAAEFDPGGARALGSATALPFADGAFDVVVATTMTHHLEGREAVVRHFQEAARVARRAALICDLHRNAFLYGALGAVLVGLGAPAIFRGDGLLSVRRGWRVGEWRSLADEAGLPGARVWMEHASRILFAVTKEPVVAGLRPGERRTAEESTCAR